MSMVYYNCSTKVIARDNAKISVLLIKSIINPEGAPSWLTDN